MRTSLKPSLLFAPLLVLAVLALAPASALAASAWWHITSAPRPASIKPGSEAQLIVVVNNLGDGATSGAPVQILDTLPPGLEVAGGVGATPFGGPPFFEFEEGLVGCLALTEASVSCGSDFALAPYQGIEITIPVRARADAETGLNEVSVSGGEAPALSVRRPLPVSDTPASFGVQDYEVEPEEVGGAIDAQAGSHPFQLTTTVILNQEKDSGPEMENVVPVALAKDLNFKLPPGLVGNPTPLPQCTLQQFLTIVNAVGIQCPQQTAIGVETVRLNVPELGEHMVTVPLFNLEPEVGEPARFGFNVRGTPVFLDTSVRTGGDYGVTVKVDNISQEVAFQRAETTIWGVPGDARHNNARGEACLATTQFPEFFTPEKTRFFGFGTCTVEEERHPLSFLSLPTSCTGPLQSTVEADSWKQEGVFRSFSLSEPLPALDGCNRLSFTPSVKVTPDGQAGSTPTGLTVDEHVPQESTLDAEGLAESMVKGLSVTLPEGVALNPSASDGLQSCSMEQIALQSPAAPSCPEASKIAAVKIRTPLLPEPLEGAAYLAAQEANPFGSLVAMYVEAYNPISGIRVKAAGEVVANPVTGQLTAHFEGDPLFENDPAYAGDIAAQFLPQAPFEDVELHFFGGDRAPLGTPAKCGAYTTAGTFTPWSGKPSTESSSTFDITSGPNKGPCPGASLPFSPELTAGTTSNQAGGFTPFTMTMSREDGQQSLSSIALHMPQGLSGLLAGVELCPEAQADEGTCAPNSLIGETTVGVGLGSDPYTVKGGRVYITGPYQGAPFGLSIVNPAKAGPFDLEKTSKHSPACDCLVVRAKIEVNPITAALTITSNPPGTPYSIPTIIEGIPLEIKHVNVTITRPQFTFNPTNCNKLAITGTLLSSESASDALSVPFQVTNCATLAFKPGFAVSTSGKTSRASGASLHVKLTYPKAPFGSQANIQSVKVDLPKQLPSRLTTLQKACPAKTFEANPAGCQAASIVGHATAITPLIPVPLTGPAYFVSYGGAKFPELVVVLQGYGVTLNLHGETFINKAGITSSTFHTIPDAPVGSFELTLPEGKYSALAANGNLCKSKLAMPTAFTAQNGTEIHESTPISVTGCAKSKKKAKKGKKASRKGITHGKKK